MEGGSSIGIYIAYGVICFFLLALALVLMRTMVLYSLLLLEPLRDLAEWFGWRRRPRPPMSTAEEARPPADERGPGTSG